MVIRARVCGYGSYLPARILTNAELAQTVDTNDEWIVERTGIRQRHIAAKDELTSHMAAKAATAALANADMDADSIDMLILATSTPDDTVPSTATKAQHLIGMKHGAAFDINAACSGFVYGLSIADSFIRSGGAKRILVIGAEIFSRIVDWKDRGTCILFGDGAGAVVLEAAEGKGDTSDRGILFSRIYSNGENYAILKTGGGLASTGHAGTLTMAGKEVFRHAVSKMGDAAEEGLKTLGLTHNDVDWVIPHQANIRIMEAIAKRMEIDDKKFVSTVREHANTSAASIPLAIAATAQQGRIKPGQLLVMPALGAGLTWGACILRW